MFGSLIGSVFGVALGFGELAVVLVLGLLLFGSYLPRVARSLGQTISEFRREARTLREDVRLPTV